MQSHSSLQISARCTSSIRSRHDYEYVSVMSDKPSKLKIADREFTSRLLIGTGKFSSNEAMRDALVASGTEIVTVALRRADLSGKHDPFANILDFIDPKKFLLLPNTSGARDANDAVRIARLAAVAGFRHGSSSRFIPIRTICFPIRSRRSLLPRFS